MRRRLGGLLLAAPAWAPSITPMTSDSFMMRSSSPSILTSVPDHLPNRMRSPAFSVERQDLAALVASARADGDDFAFLRLLLGGVGNDDAALRLLLALEAANDDTVVQRAEFHVFPLVPTGRCPRDIGAC